MTDQSINKFMLEETNGPWVLIDSGDKLMVRLSKGVFFVPLLMALIFVAISVVVFVLLPKERIFMIAFGTIALVICGGTFAYLASSYHREPVPVYNRQTHALALGKSGMIFTLPSEALRLQLIDGWYSGSATMPWAEANLIVVGDDGHAVRYSIIASSGGRATKAGEQIANATGLQIQSDHIPFADRQKWAAS